MLLGRKGRDIYVECQLKEEKPNEEKANCYGLLNILCEHHLKERCVICPLVWSNKQNRTRGALSCYHRTPLFLFLTSLLSCATRNGLRCWIICSSHWSREEQESVGHHQLFCHLHQHHFPRPSVGGRPAHRGL